MKLIVAGGRNFFDKQRMQGKLIDLTLAGVIPQDVELVCGMAKGADLMAKSIFEGTGLVVHKRPADWKDMSPPCVRKRNQYGYYNALAGTKRNHAMGDESDMLLAFWNGKSTGTKDMITYMFSLNKSVIIEMY